MTLLLLLLLSSVPKPNDKHFTVTVNPRVIQAPPFQPVAFITAKQEGDEEGDYCAGVELSFGLGFEEQKFSTETQDCPSWEDHVKQEREWEECSQRVCVAPPGDECTWKCSEPVEVKREWVWRTDRLHIVFDVPTQINVKFLFANGRTITKSTSIHVGGQ